MNAVERTVWFGESGLVVPVKPLVFFFWCLDNFVILARDKNGFHGLYQASRHRVPVQVGQSLALVGLKAWNSRSGCQGFLFAVGAFPVYGWQRH